ncbi:MAG: DUF2945 domain-containing protein [Alphaproteobacteria bacterium]
MAKFFDVGTRVSWNWGSGQGEGSVREVFRERVEKTIKGSEVVRNASEDDPAYLVVQDDGDVVLKSQSELEDA